MKTFFGALIILAILFAGYFLYTGQATEPDGGKTYANASYGISFAYPDTYVLEEREVGNAERYHFAITLMDRIASENIPQNGEGPTSITIDIFQNNLDKLSTEAWVKGNSNSNFKLSADGLLTSTTVAGREALHYTWDGLYRGESTVFAHKDNIVMLSVTYLSPTDTIVSNFANVLASFQSH